MAIEAEDPGEAQGPWRNGAVEAVAAEGGGLKETDPSPNLGAQPLGEKRDPGFWVTDGSDCRASPVCTGVWSCPGTQRAQVPPMGTPGHGGRSPCSRCLQPGSGSRPDTPAQEAPGASGGSAQTVSRQPSRPLSSDRPRQSLARLQGSQRPEWGCGQAPGRGSGPLYPARHLQCLSYTPGPEGSGPWWGCQRGLGQGGGSPATFSVVLAHLAPRTAACALAAFASRSPALSPQAHRSGGAPVSSGAQRPQAPQDKASSVGTPVLASGRQHAGGCPPHEAHAEAGGWFRSEGARRLSQSRGLRQRPGGAAAAARVARSAESPAGGAAVSHGESGRGFGLRGKEGGAGEDVPAHRGKPHPFSRRPRPLPRARAEERSGAPRPWALSFPVRPRGRTAAPRPRGRSAAQEEALERPGPRESRPPAGLPLGRGGAAPRPPERGRRGEDRVDAAALPPPPARRRPFRKQFLSPVDELRPTGPTPEPTQAKPAPRPILGRLGSVAAAVYPEGRFRAVGRRRGSTELPREDLTWKRSGEATEMERQSESPPLRTGSSGFGSHGMFTGTESRRHRAAAAPAGRQVASELAVWRPKEGARHCGVAPVTSPN
ncbi:hypothetical protein AB1E18_018068 [Capra hircus]